MFQRLSLFFFYCLTFISIHDGNKVFAGQERKIETIHEYITPPQIFFIDNSIFIALNEQLIQVDAIFTDAFGMYIKFPSGTRDWECPKCEHVNHKTAQFCDNCLWDPRKDPQ